MKIYLLHRNSFSFYLLSFTELISSFYLFALINLWFIWEECEKLLFDFGLKKKKKEGASTE